MNFGYFWVFWRIFFGYTGIPLPPWPTLIDVHVLSSTRLIRTTVNTEKRHFSVFPSPKISCRQPRFMDTGNHWLPIAATAYFLVTITY